MARYGAISAVGESVVRFLKGAFAGFPGGVPTIEQVTTRTLQPGSGGRAPIDSSSRALTLLLYRVDLDPTQRHPCQWIVDPPGSLPRKRYALGVDLRYLLTAWAEQPEVQQNILALAMVELAGHSTFGQPDLVKSFAGVTDIWQPDESIQIVPDEMSTEDQYQIWESLGRGFELSVPLRARGVRLAADALDGAGDVLERRLGYGTYDGSSA